MFNVLQLEIKRHLFEHAEDQLRISIKILMPLFDRDDMLFYYPIFKPWKNA